MSLVGPRQGSLEYQGLKDWYQPRMAIMREVLEEVERIESGAEDPNTDFLGADGTPSESRFR